MRHQRHHWRSKVLIQQCTRSKFLFQASTTPSHSRPEGVAALLRAPGWSFPRQNQESANCVDGWTINMYVCMYVCMHGWMDGWMGVCMYVCMRVMLCYVMVCYVWYCNVVSCYVM